MIKEETTYEEITLAGSCTGTCICCSGMRICVKVEVKSDTYYASSELNLRSDASADADLISSVAAGTQLNSTGVCENGWIRVDYNGQTCYASGDFVTTTAPAADAGETAADTSADTSYDESAE